MIVLQHRKMYVPAYIKTGVGNFEPLEMEDFRIDDGTYTFPITDRTDAYDLVANVTHANAKGELPEFKQFSKVAAEMWELCEPGTTTETLHLSKNGVWHVTMRRHGPDTNAEFTRRPIRVRKSQTVPVTGYHDLEDIFRGAFSVTNSVEQSLEVVTSLNALRPYKGSYYVIDLGKWFDEDKMVHTLS